MRLSFSPKLLGNDVAEMIIDRILLGALKVGISIPFCQDQHDVRTRGHSMSPHYVQRDLLRPTGHVGITGYKRNKAIRRDLCKRCQGSDRPGRQAHSAGQTGKS